MGGNAMRRVISQHEVSLSIARRLRFRHTSETPGLSTPRNDAQASQFASLEMTVSREVSGTNKVVPFPSRVTSNA